MSGNITTMPLGEGLEDSKTDWKHLKEMRDEDIDYSDIPPLDDAFWKDAVVVRPDTTERITLRLKKSVLEHFKEGGSKGYQTRINHVLESYVRSQERTR